jgi:hypothetical protein
MTLSGTLSKNHKLYIFNKKQCQQLPVKSEPELEPKQIVKAPQRCLYLSNCCPGLSTQFFVLHSAVFVFKHVTATSLGLRQ